MTGAMSTVRIAEVVGVKRSNPGVAATESLPSEHLAFERQLVDLSSRFTNVRSEQVEPEIERALRQLIAFLGVDRATFGEFTAGGDANVLCSVAVDGVEPFPCGPIPDSFSWYLEEVRAGRTIVIPSIDDLPPEATGTAEVLRRSGLRSHVGIPIRVDGRIAAGIGFAAFRSLRVWPKDLIARLKLIGEVFAQALARKRYDEKITAALEEVRQLKARLERENAYLKETAQTKLPQGLLSRSPRFKAVLADIAQVAPTGSTVLILGETGSGKEVVAQAIHDASGRKGRPMIKVNCAALPATLIESELFGREKGAYTGAMARQAGRFEVADGSTIFLDEIGELPLELQSKLLRVLQEGEFERLGGTQTIKINARMIAATNRDLARAVSEGKFREDLFYRLNVFPIEVPPLRDRREDIALLAWTFVKEFSATMGKPIERIAEESMTAMEAYAWPGNVRELRNVIERAMILARGPTLYVVLGRTAIHKSSPKATEGTLEECERTHILSVLNGCRWRIRGCGGAGELLDMKPTTLEARIKKLGLKRPQ
jgi:transcriptional regulator with GAF, ATPase, and Fis domain